MESLKRYGIAEGDTDIVVAKFDAQPDDVSPSRCVWHTPDLSIIHSPYSQVSDKFGTIGDVERLITLICHHK